MSQASLTLTYSQAQDEVFFKSRGIKYRVYPKGRRLGMTLGAAQALTEYCLAGDGPILWADTIYPNIDRYVERYFMPVLRKLPAGLWTWRQQKKQLDIGGQLIDFRSADKPENWEGFGYRVIFMNEAGIILRNRYLYEQAVLPMMLDFPEAELIAAGTPKGTDSVFYELWQRVVNREPHYTGKQFSSYENPFLDASQINELKEQITTDAARQQEIYGHFVSSDTNSIIGLVDVESAIARWPADSQGLLTLGVDVAYQGDDVSVIWPRRGDHAYQPIERSGLDPLEVAQEVMRVVAKMQHAGEKPVVNVDVIGIGAGVYAALKRHANIEVNGVNVAQKAHNSDHYHNMRAEMWEGMATWLMEGGAVPDVSRLAGELTAVRRIYDNRGRIQISKKDDVKKMIGRSTDYADALALSIYAPPRKARPGGRVIG